MDQKSGADLASLELRLLEPGRALIIGAVGGTLAVLFYKTCELLVRGFMGGSFQLSPSEQVATVILILVAAILIFLAPSGRHETERLRKENDERVRWLLEELERIERERIERKRN